MASPDIPVISHPQQLPHYNDKTKKFSVQYRTVNMC